MKGGKKPQPGFTIVETLIVLAVSGIIFLSAVLLISGRINRTEFSQAVGDIQSKTQQRINEVINGYYPNNNDIKCTADNSGLHITAGASGQGTNPGCIFIGKAIQFAVDTDSSKYNVYTIAALRETAPGSDVASTTLAQAQPALIAAGQTGQNINFPDEFEQEELQNGLSVVGMYYNNNLMNEIGSVFFLSSLGSINADNNLESGSQQVDLYVIPGKTSLNSPKLNEVDAIDQFLVAATQVDSVQVCFKSSTTANNWALMNIGTSNSNRLAVTIKIQDTDCNATHP